MLCPKTRKLYVSMDITFHETELFYRAPTPNLPFQGENSEEVINYEELEAFFIKNSENISSSGDSSGQGEFFDGREELSVVEPLSHDRTKDNALHDRTMPPDNSTQPLSQSSSEIPPEVSTNPNSTCSDDLFSESQVSQYCLPPRSNRGVPPVKYESDPKSKVRYPISNHVSCQKLSKSYVSYVLQLSSVSIPSKMQEALADDRWTQAMAEEMAALEKNDT